MLAVSAISNLYAENDYKAGEEKWKRGGEEITYFKNDAGPGFQSHGEILTLTKASRH